MREGRPDNMTGTQRQTVGHPETLFHTQLCAGEVRGRYRWLNVARPAPESVDRRLACNVLKTNGHGHKASGADDSWLEAAAGARGGRYGPRGQPWQGSPGPTDEVPEPGPEPQGCWLPGHPGRRGALLQQRGLPVRASGWPAPSAYPLAPSSPGFGREVPCLRRVGFPR